MDKDTFKKEWQHFLIDIGMSEAELSKAIKAHAPNINRKISQGTIKYLELSEIVEKYSYNIHIRKD